MSRRVIYLTKKSLIVISIYYILIFLFSLRFIITFFSNDLINYSSLHNTINLSIYCSILGSSLYYIRKLYKDSFADGKINLKDGSFLQHFGSNFYYYTRPFFAIAFSILVILGYKSGFNFISTPKSELNPNNFIYLSAVSSLIIGFSIGKVITKLENNNI